MAHLLDPERLRERALIHIALAAADYDGSALSSWVTARIHEAIQDLLRRDAAESRSGVPLRDEADPRYSFLIETLGVEPGKTREASVAFNRLDAPIRQAFFALVLRGRRVRDCVEEGMGTTVELIRRTRAALVALLDMPSLLELPDPPDRPGAIGGSR